MRASSVTSMSAASGATIMCKSNTAEASASLMLRGRPGLSLEREAVGMFDRVDGEIDIQVGPGEMMRLGSFDMQDRLNGRPFEPRKFLER